MSAQEKAVNEEQTEQEKMPLWLKNMPDDPSLLLRRKMQLEYQKRERSSETNNNGVIW